MDSQSYKELLKIARRKYPKSYAGYTGVQDDGELEIGDPKTPYFKYKGGKKITNNKNNETI